jgi:1-acyl-sn-glycerol-3-phosphate acyltransferase
MCLGFNVQALSFLELAFPSGPARIRYNLIRNLLYKAGRAMVWLYARLMLQVDVSWHVPLPAGPKLIVANHPSTTDPFYLNLLSSQPMNLLIIEHPFLVPVFGTYLRWSGHVPVVPGQGRSAFDDAHLLLKKGRTVALFPEGDVSPRHGGLLPPHSGAARLALLTGVPIVPVGIYLPLWRCRTIVSRIAGRDYVGYWYVRGTYSMTVGQALYGEGDVEDRAGVGRLSNRIMQQIHALALESEWRAKGAVRRVRCPAPAMD